MNQSTKDGNELRNGMDHMPASVTTECNTDGTNWFKRKGITLSNDMGP